MATTVTTSTTGRLKCFVIMPLADVDGYDKGHFSRVYKELIAPACEAAGFVPETAAETKQSHQIMSHILRSIVSYDMAICDLSTSNPNVFYELGIRQMAKMPVALIKDERTVDKFDVSQRRREQYSSSLRSDLVKEEIEIISQAIKQTYQNREAITSEFLADLNVRLQIDPEQVIVSKGEALIEKKIDLVLENLANYRPTPIPEYGYPLKDVNGLPLGRGDFYRYEFIKGGNVPQNPADNIYFITGVIPQDDCIISLGRTDAHSGLCTHMILHTRIGTLALRKLSHEWVKQTYPNTFEAIRSRAGNLQYLFNYF